MKGLIFKDGKFKFNDANERFELVPIESKDPIYDHFKHGESWIHPRNKFEVIETKSNGKKEKVSGKPIKFDDALKRVGYKEPIPPKPPAEPEPEPASP